MTAADPISTTGVSSVQGPRAVRLHQILLAAAVAVPAIVFVYAGLVQRADAIRDEQDNVLHVVELMDALTRKIFQTADLALARVEDNVRGKSWDTIAAPETSEFLAELKAPLPHMVAIWISDAGGAVRAGSRLRREPLSLAEHEFYQELRETPDGRVVISSPYIEPVSQMPSFAVGRRLMANGRFAGTIHLSLSADYFRNSLIEASRGRPYVAALVRDDGMILVRVPSAPALRTLGPESPLLHRIARDSPLGSMNARSAFDGQVRFIAYRRVADYPVYVSYGVTADALLQHWYRNLWTGGLVTLGAAGALLLVSWLALRRARSEQETLLRLSAETEQRRIAEQQLFLVQKTESIGKLTGGIAHDFNNLLAIVIGNLTLAKKRAPTGDQRLHEFLDRAMQGADRGAQLTQRLRTFARKQELAPRNIDLQFLVGDMTKLFRRSLGSDVGIAIVFPPALPPVFVDPNHLELALLNLALNARDAMPEGGTITISARAEAVTRHNFLHLTAGSYMVLSVTDTGHGMDEETMRHATEPFFTTKEVGKGSGLGLSAVDGLAAQSGGTFRLFSQLGAGTTAEIWLPQGTGTAATTSTGDQPAAALVPASTVLVVDDDLLVALSTATMVEDLGHKAIPVHSGDEALRLLATGIHIDVVMTDQSMPRMTGTQLADQIRERWPELPVFLASGHAEVVAGEELGLPLLKKPFHRKALADAIASALNGASPKAVAV